MPFPLAHGVIAATLFAATQEKVSLKEDRRRLLLCAGLAVVPDTDFFIQWAFELRGWHRGITHSVVFAVAIGLLALLPIHIRTLRRSSGILLASISHGLLDALVTNRGSPGVQLLWPFSSSRFGLTLFDYFQFNFNPWVDPWVDIAGHLLKVSLIEAVVVVPLLILVLSMKRTDLLKSVER